jgi:anti-anti-sigma factor
MALDLERERRGGVLVLAPKGRLDNENAADFELAMQEVLSAGERHLLLDLAGLGYVSNAGLRTMGRLAKSLNTPTTSLRVAGLSDTLRQVFDAAGVSVLFDIRPDRETALADHPAAQGAALAVEVCRLLGIDAAVPPPEAAPDSAKLAELAMDILSTRGRQTRAVRAMAQGTQVMQRVVATPAAASAAARKPGFWQRLFGRRPK